MYESYQSAEMMPWKLIRNHKDIIIDTRIKPICIHLKPTNRCNANCKWCSVSDRNKQDELSLGEIQSILDHFINLGTKAVSISGGGEPTIHPNFEQIIEHCIYRGLKIGLTTNALKLYRHKELTDLLNKSLTWIRISVIETVEDYNWDIVRDVCAKLKNIDCGISFVVGKAANLRTVDMLCGITRDSVNIKHIRFIADINQSSDISVVNTMHLIERLAKSITEKVIIQTRQHSTHGMKTCYISKLKPQIAANGCIYPCCGIQYAIPGSDYNTLFNMGRWDNFSNMLIFDGSHCLKCFYNPYNETISHLLKPLVHEDFV